MVAKLTITKAERVARVILAKIKEEENSVGAR